MYYGINISEAVICRINGQTVSLCNGRQHRVCARIWNKFYELRKKNRSEQEEEGREVSAEAAGAGVTFNANQRESPVTSKSRRANFHARAISEMKRARARNNF